MCQLRQEPEGPPSGISALPTFRPRSELFSARLESLQSVKDLFRVLGGSYLGEDFLYFALGREQEGLPCDPHVLLAEGTLLLQNSVVGAHLFIYIGEQVVGQIVFIFEFLLLGNGVGADAEHDCSGLLDLAECVAEPARFDGSTWGVCLGKKEEHGRFAAKRRQGHGFV